MAVNGIALSRRTDRIYLLALLLFSTLAINNAFAYFNVTQINTTVLLSTNTSAKVVETLFLNISNSSVNGYIKDRSAYNLSLSGWQNILQTSLLTPHLLSPYGSIKNLTFLPTVLIPAGNGGHAELLMSYYVENLTTVMEVAPRKFLYTFNNSALNFAHTAGGEAILANQRFTIIIPRGTQVLSIYPLPDSPAPNFVGNYTNQTTFSWYEAEPLNRFSFSFIETQSLQDEVTSYFSNVYTNDKPWIYLGLIALVALLGFYIYDRFVK